MRQLRKGYVVCGDCEGSGAHRSDCWLCKGRRYIRAKLAYRHRYRKEDLDDIEDDGYCRCPACGGDTCVWCNGDGEVAADIEAQQETRVLVYGLTQRIPPLRVRQYWRGGRVALDDALLSTHAARACRDKGWINWFCSVFGDEIYLTPLGEAEAKRRYVGWLCSFDSTQAPLDIHGRFDDDGGCLQAGRAALAENTGGA
jgi:hypothetical protein